MKKILLVSLILALSPVALAQDTTNTTTTDTTSAPLDPNNDGVVDTNNNGRADTREFPWGLLGLIGLAGLAGLNRRPTTVTEVRAEPHNQTRR